MNKEDQQAADGMELSFSRTREPRLDAESSADQFRQRMMPVPGFRPPPAKQGEFCPLPNCSQEELNEFRSAGVLLKALAAEAKAWSRSLPENYRPAIMALLHGNLQIQVQTLTQVSFDGIKIDGLMGDSPCSVLAHQDTVQLMCYAICTDEVEEEEKHPIGFIWPEHEEKV